MEPEKAFFTAGLKFYGKALLAISEFKKLLESELQNVMGAQPPGSMLELAAEPRFTTESTGPPWTYIGVSGILARQVGNSRAALRTPAWLHVGVWWTPTVPCATEAALIAGVPDVAWAKRIVKPDGFNGRLYTEGTDVYLMRDLADQDKFSEVVGELLGHLDRACKEQQPTLLTGASESR